jgi:hypothetical protein
MDRIVLAGCFSVECKPAIALAKLAIPLLLTAPQRVF